MTRQKVRWIALLASITVITGAFWYTRPVDIHVLSSNAEEPDMIFAALTLHGGSSSEIQSRSNSFTPEDPEWETVLEQLESLRFRRPPWNFPLQFVNESHITGRQTHPGDWHLMCHVVYCRSNTTSIQFFLDEWMYTSPHSNRNLTLFVDNSKETGAALSEALWPLLIEEESESDVSRETYLHQ